MRDPFPCSRKFSFFGLSATRVLDLGKTLRESSFIGTVVVSYSMLLLTELATRVIVPC
jgi:hypothetical protein